MDRSETNYPEDVLTRQGHEADETAVSLSKRKGELSLSFEEWREDAKNEDVRIIGSRFSCQFTARSLDQELREEEQRRAW